MTYLITRRDFEQVTAGMTEEEKTELLAAYDLRLYPDAPDADETVKVDQERVQAGYAALLFDWRGPAPRLLLEDLVDEDREQFTEPARRYFLNRVVTGEPATPRSRRFDRRGRAVGPPQVEQRPT